MDSDLRTEDLGLLISGGLIDLDLAGDGLVTSLLHNEISLFLRPQYLSH